MEKEALLHKTKTVRDKIEWHLRKDIAAIGESVDSYLAEILTYGLFGGGKRFRPLLAVIAAKLCANDSEDVYRIAIALEYLHLATLFHDDVIDKADIRRGKPTVVKAYGLDAAILVGDFLHARAMEMIGLHGGVASLERICAATRGIVKGEIIQLRNVQNFSQSERDYFSAIEGKTAQFISAAVQIGANMGKCDISAVEALGVYGRGVGFAFQIVDDLLDYCGDAEKTGKKIGNDLEEGKMTLPLIYALEQADISEKQRLLQILKNESLRRDCFDEVYALIDRCEGFSRTREKAEYFIAEAVASLSAFGEKHQITEVQILKDLAYYTLLREK